MRLGGCLWNVPASISEPQPARPHAPDRSSESSLPACLKVDRMDQNNSSGLSPVWLISLAMVLGTAIVVLLPASIASGDPIKASDWIGFAGNVLAGAMTILAALIAWFAVQKQIGAQQKIAEHQIAAQRIAILQDRLTILLNDYRLAWKLRSAAASLGFIPRIFLPTPLVTIADSDQAISKYNEAAARLEQISEEFDMAETRRWSRNVGMAERSEVGLAISKLLIAEIANRKNLAKLKGEIWKSAKFPAEGTAPTPAIDLSTEIKTVDEACLAYINAVHAEMRRLDELINESGTHVGL
jgi:hypothetical protein